jgi:hypothetical protein
LYLYSYYTMSAGTFFSATVPIWLLSAILLSALCCFIEKSPLEAPPNPRKAVPVKPLVIYGGLTVVCMLVVFRVLPWPYMLGAVILTLLVFDAKALKSADFYLLLTFVCFFVFAGNLARVEAVDSLLKSLLKGREILVGAAASQLISNVPAAILLSGFTIQAKALLLGVDIGGLGTPIASLASLIGLKLYSRSPQPNMKRFLLLFLAVNGGLLCVLLLIGGFFV